jgi:hypothetical protein
LNVGGIARWDGRGWRKLGDGVDGIVRTIAVGQDRVYVGGAFDSAGTIASQGVACWNIATSSWESLAGGVGGADPIVHALAIDGSTLYVGGEFDSAGGKPARRIAGWNFSTREWSSPGSGIGGSSFYTYVTALAVSGSDLYVGGVFSRAGGVDALNIARWDGSAWSALGEGIDNEVLALAARPGGGVYVGGEFSRAGDLPVENLALWDGSTWTAPFGGVDAPVLALATRGGELFVGGTFSGVAGYPVVTQRLAQWSANGGWEALGSGVHSGFSGGDVYALAVAGGDLFAGGTFTIAGEKPSYYFARWMKNLASSDGGRSKDNAITVRRSHVYPNPATDIATILIESPTGEHADVTIWTSNGEFVERLEDGVRGSEAYHVRWETKGYAEGVYFYRIETASAVDIGTITVLRSSR